MSTNEELNELVVKVEQLLAMLEPLEKKGDESASLVADGVRHQLTRLQEALASGDSDRLRHILLDLVPSAKALDAIDFRIDLYPDMDALRSYIRGIAAEIAKPLIDAL